MVRSWPELARVIVSLLEVGVELALRGKATTNVLDYDGVTGLHGALDVKRNAATADYCVLLVVWGACEKHRGRCCAVKAIHVSREPDCIAHRQHDVLLNQR